MQALMDTVGREPGHGLVTLGDLVRDLVGAGVT
jgi:hypothetical protein